MPSQNVWDRHSPQPKPLDRISKRSEAWKLGKVTAEKRRVKKIFNLDVSNIADKGGRAENKHRYREENDDLTQLLSSFPG